MYLIDASYFQRELSIPNVLELQSGTADELELYIDNKVRFILREILGWELYNDLDSNITNGTLNAVAPQKWQHFVNGNDTDYKGLLFDDGVYKVSMLSHYAYYYWLYDNVSQVTATGEKVAAAVNATNIVSTQRLVKTWNDFVNLYSGGIDGTYYFKGIVNGILFTDYFGHRYENGFKTVAGYLLENKDLFPTAIVPNYKYKNSLGL